jgi:hypothetical protein
MAAAENRCAECLIWKQKHTNEANRLRQASDKISRLERDIISANATTDAVIAKWTAHVKLIMEERAEAEAKRKQPPTAPPAGGVSADVCCTPNSCVLLVCDDLQPLSRPLPPQHHPLPPAPPIATTPRCVLRSKKPRRGGSFGGHASRGAASPARPRLSDSASRLHQLAV